MSRFIVAIVCTVLMFANAAPSFARGGGGGGHSSSHHSGGGGGRHH